MHHGSSVNHRRGFNVPVFVICMIWDNFAAKTIDSLTSLQSHRPLGNIPEVLCLSIQHSRHELMQVSSKINFNNQQHTE